MHFQIEMYKKNLGISEIKMQQSVPMLQISEINMQQTFHVLQYLHVAKVSPLPVVQYSLLPYLSTWGQSLPPHSSTV